MPDKPEEFVVTRKVLWNDCDPAGVVYTGRFTYFVLEAAEAFGEALLGPRPDRKSWAEGLGTPAVNLSLTYIKPLRPGDEIEIALRVREINKKTFDLTFEARGADGQVKFTAELGLICVVSSARKPIDMPEEMILALRQWEI